MYYFPERSNNMSIQILWTLALLALVCEYVDSTLGMGYGTTLTPILLLIGYEPAQIVPSVLLVLAMGVSILLTIGRTFGFSWKKVVGLGLLAAFNKGISGGGYGPLVCGGQVLAGVGEKEAIGITSLAEGLVCIVGVLAYYLTGNGGVDWGLAPSLVLGAVVSVPFAALTVSKIPLRHMRWAIGIAVTALGLFTLGKLVF
jgi:uncharacterized membrane protein YfcA